MIDGVIVNTIKAICDLYNEDFYYYKDYEYVYWWDVNTWDFKECHCASPDYINMYFNQPRFFEKLEYMDWANEVLYELSKNYSIFIVSMGYSPNIKGKKEWIRKNLPYCNFIGVNYKEHKDKAHIDMSCENSIFIDDSVNNLFTSNAKHKICFGDKYTWNKEWDGKRCSNWLEMGAFLKEGIQN